MGLLGGAVLGLLVVLMWRGAAWLGQRPEGGAAVALAGRAGGGGVCLPHPGPIRFNGCVRLIPSGQRLAMGRGRRDRLVELQQEGPQP